MKKSNATKKEEKQELINKSNHFLIGGTVKWVADDGNRFILSCPYVAENKEGKEYQAYASVTITDFSDIVVEVGDNIEVAGRFTTRKGNDERYYNNLVAITIKED